MSLFTGTSSRVIQSVVPAGALLLGAVLLMTPTAWSARDAMAPKEQSNTGDIDPSKLPSTMIGKLAPATNFPPVDGLLADSRTVPGFATADLPGGKCRRRLEG